MTCRHSVQNSHGVKQNRCATFPRASSCKICIIGQMQSDWFRERMVANNVSEDDIADALGRDRSTVNRIINGQRGLRLAEVEAVAKKINVSVLELLRHAYSWQDEALVTIADNWEKSSEMERRRLVRMIRARLHGDDEPE